MPRQTYGLIYFVQCGDRFGPIKIGTSINQHARLSSLQTGCPFELRMLGFIEVSRDLPSEKGMHERFSAQRIRGEWFAWSADLQTFIDQHLAEFAVRNKKALMVAVRSLDRSPESPDGVLKVS